MNSFAISDNYIRVRISQEIKDQASEVLAFMGLDLSDAVSILLIRIAKERKFPFSTVLPNEETRKAIEAGDRGELTEYENLETVLNEINE